MFDISTEVAPKGKVWVVKSGGGEPIPTQPAGLDPTVIRSGSSVGELPCSNHFDVLKLMNDPNDAARVKVLDSVVAEVIIDSEVLVNKEAMDISNVVTVSNSSKDMGESSLYAALPNELGVGMVDPDAVFQALMSASK